MVDIDPELIEKAAEEISAEKHGYRVDHSTWAPYCTCGWSSESAHDVAAYIRHLAARALEAVADDLRAEGAAQALREAANDIERRINEPDLILLADKYGGFHAGERHRAQREVDILRSRADRIEHDARCPHRKCPGGSLCCCPEEARDE